MHVFLFLFPTKDFLCGDTNRFFFYDLFVIYSVITHVIIHEPSLVIVFVALFFLAWNKNEIGGHTYMATVYFTKIIYIERLIYHLYIHNIEVYDYVLITRPIIFLSIVEFCSLTNQTVHVCYVESISLDWIIEKCCSLSQFDRQMKVVKFIYSFYTG